MNIIRMKIYSKRLGMSLFLVAFALAIIYVADILTSFFPIMIVSLGAVTAFATLHDDEIIWPLKLIVIALDIVGVFKILQTFHSFS